MTIKQKDGNVYILQGPNKLAENQIKWDFNKLIFHNFDWDEITCKNNLDITDVISKDNINSSFEPKIADTKIAHFEKEEQKEENKTNDIEQQFHLPFLRKKVIMKCLPAIVHNKKDPLYGETWLEISYSSKIIFPTVIISIQDLFLEFWTTDPENVISEHSIVYPFLYEIYNNKTQSYDKVPFDDRRWWKVNKKEKKDNGWLFTSAPSKDQPDFS